MKMSYADSGKNDLVRLLGVTMIKNELPCSGGEYILYHEL